MKKLLLLIQFMCLALLCSAQHPLRPCGFDDWVAQDIAPSTEQRIQAAVAAQKHRMQRSGTADTIRTIPVVVHVIHNGGAENISDAQVLSQFQVLEEDFGKVAGSNGDGNGVDTRVRFCLAQIDPNGNCTNGIVRIQSPLANHQSHERALLKELSFWDNTRYLNIYVVRSINGSVGGYSSFPGGPPDEDGVVVRHNLFGNMGTASGLGRVTTHELGHWLGIYHVFNNGCGADTCSDGDYVCDTPPANGPHYTCGMFNTCSNDVPDVNDQVENYMDYSPDACQNMWTNGQKLRMRGSLDSIRIVIWQDSNLVSTGCDSNYTPPANCAVVADFVAISKEICKGNGVYFADRSLNNATAWQWYFPGGNPATSTSQNPTVTYDSVGVYDVTLIASDSAGSDTLTLAGYITVTPPGIGDSLYFSEDFELGVYPIPTLTINNLDGGVTWELDSAAAVSGRFSYKINNLINTNYGSADELQLPALDLTTSHPDSIVQMRFKWAYAKSDAVFSDEMMVLLSKDCGVTWSQIFYRTQGAMTTGPTQTTPFIPTSSQWKSAFIPLNFYRTESNLMLKIVNVTDGGNNLYIEDIYVGDGLGLPIAVSQPLADEFSVIVHPNPVAGSQFRVLVKGNHNRELVAKLYDLHGGLRFESRNADVAVGDFSLDVPVQNLPAGMYFVHVSAGKQVRTVPVLVRK